MHVDIVKDGLLIVADTKFEEQYLDIFPVGTTLVSYVKNGLTTGDRLGVIVTMKEYKNE